MPERSTDHDVPPGDAFPAGASRGFPGFPPGVRRLPAGAAFAASPLPAPEPQGVEAGLHALFRGPLQECPALLVVAAAGAHRSGWGADAAVELASVAAEHAGGVVLADLAAGGPALHERLGVPNEEGVADAILYGVSLARAVRPVPGRPFSLLARGMGGDAAELLESPRWARLVAEAERRLLLLLLYVPADTPGLDALASRVERVVLLAGAGDGEVAPPPGAVAVAVLSAEPGDSDVVPVADELQSPEEVDVEPEPAAEIVDSVTLPDAAVEPVATADGVDEAEPLHAAEPAEATSVEADAQLSTEVIGETDATADVDPRVGDEADDDLAPVAAIEPTFVEEAVAAEATHDVAEATADVEPAVASAADGAPADDFTWVNSDAPFADHAVAEAEVEAQPAATEPEPVAADATSIDDDTPADLSLDDHDAEPVVVVDARDEMWMDARTRDAEAAAEAWAADVSEAPTGHADAVDVVDADDVAVPAAAADADPEPAVETEPAVADVRAQAVVDEPVLIDVVEDEAPQVASSDAGTEPAASSGGRVHSPSALADDWLESEVVHEPVESRATRWSRKLRRGPKPEPPQAPEPEPAPQPVANWTEVPEPVDDTAPAMEAFPDWTHAPLPEPDDAPAMVLPSGDLSPAVAGADDGEEMTLDQWLAAAGLNADVVTDTAPAAPRDDAPPLDLPADEPPVARRGAEDDLAYADLMRTDALAAAPAATHDTAVATAPDPRAKVRDEDDDRDDDAPPPPSAGGPDAPSPRYLVPRIAAWKERLIRWLAVVTLCVWTYYIVWRWGWTLNPDALWFSVPLALAETWGLIAAFVMAHSVWRLRHRVAPPAPEGLRADVFVTCFDEPLEVIRRTAIGARAIRYPHETYVLDDGKRDEVREMARELGIGYLRREGNEHAKAGNLNHALRHTSGDFILQLDADHVPLPHMLDRLLGFFAGDPRLAFVQSPQDFYNTDAFTYEVDESTRRIWEEQRLFFSVLQPGKDRVNAAFFCGSCAVIRRTALESIGGFSTHTVTEDIETSLRLHAAGWNSAYYGESLAYGLAAGSATAFHTQHLRWGQGAMQVLRRFNPLTLPGLTLAQRISYFGSLTAYVNGVQKLVFLLAPIIFFVTGVLPIRALNAEFLARFLPVLVLSITLAAAVSRGTGDLWISERYHVAKFWTYTRAVLSFFHNRPLRFRVTPKGPGHVPFRIYAPQVVLAAATVLAVAWSVMALRYGWVGYGPDGWHSPGFAANVVWASINFGLAMSVVDRSSRMHHQRADHRFRDHFPIRVFAPSAARSAAWQVGLTEDLNPAGTAFRTGRRIMRGTRVELTLPLATGTVQVHGRVVHSEAVADSEPAMFRSGVVFADVPVATRDAIELHCTGHAVPLERARYRPAERLLSRWVALLRNGRRETRHAVQLPAQVWTGRGGALGEDEGMMAFLEEISPSGARLVLDQPLEPGTSIGYRVPGTGLERSGRVVFSRAIETPIGVRYAIGISGGSSRTHPTVPARTGLVGALLNPLRFLTSGI